MPQSDTGPKELVDSVSSVVIGKKDQINLVVMTLLAGGHVLIEDIPGVGKTLLALACARSMGVRFRRIQFTSDTLPSDVVGLNVFDPKRAEFEFKAGPVFTEVLLADEINRTSPRTQSALLESMAEGKVSVDGVTYDLPQPFFVLATMNPVERYGSFELPESQLDRFMTSVSLGYPERDHEREILARDLEHTDAMELEPVTTPDRIREWRTRVRAVTLEDSVMEYLVDLVRATREHPEIRLGLSSRAGLHLKRAAQARAFLLGQDYVVPGDLRAVFLAVSIHRVVASGPAGTAGAAEHKRELLDKLLRSVEGPV